jgi:nucleoside-diphosphate-sugar epimerase
MEYREAIPDDVRDSLAGLEKVKKDLGYSPKVSIREGISKTLEWVKTQPTLHS